MSNDVVNHPSHYTYGKIEVIEVIEAWGLNFHRGNAVKYIARAGKKNPEKEIEDLQKAKWYIEREIKRLGGKIDMGIIMNFAKWLSKRSDNVIYLDLAKEFIEENEHI